MAEAELTERTAGEVAQSPRRRAPLATAEHCIATATEVSTIGIVYALIVGFLIYGLLVYRHFNWRRIVPMLIETACLSGAILLIIGCATGMAWGLTQSGFSRALAAAMTGLPGGAASFIAVSIVAFVILGSVLEGIPAIVLFGPLLFPIARAVGVHQVHYAMIIILAMGALTRQRASGRSGATCWRSLSG
jgi:TRAP-type C4-dicarboxylate transport system permease large subunit